MAFSNYVYFFFLESKQAWIKGSQLCLFFFRWQKSLPLSVIFFFFFWEVGINNFSFTKTLPTGLFQGFPAAHTKLDFHVQRISEEAKLNYTTEQKNEGVLGKQWRLGENSGKLGGLGQEFYGLVWQSEVCGLMVGLSVSHLSPPGASLSPGYANPVYPIWGTSDSPFCHATINSFTPLCKCSSIPAAAPTYPFSTCCPGRTGLLAAGMGEKGDSDNCFLTLCIRLS